MLNDLRNRGVQDILIAVVDAQAAEAALAEFEQSDLARQYPAIAPSWRRAWNEVIPFLDYPPEVRRLIYTTNAIKALNSKIRRAVRTRGHFPSDDAAAKLIYLALNATSTEWKRSVREWHAVNTDTLREVIAPVVDEDIVLVTDGHRADPRCAAAIGAHHQALNLSGRERVRDAFHIQTVNNRHSRLKDFLRRYRGVATKYLDNYLRWFQRLELENASPRACLASPSNVHADDLQTEPLNTTP